MDKQFKTAISLFFWTIIVYIMGTDAAHAVVGFDFINENAQTASAVAENMADSVSRVPGLITGLAYLMGILFGTVGVLKLKDHVENPSNTPLKESIVRFLAGGAMFSLPIIYEAMKMTIDGGHTGSVEPQNDIDTFLSNLVGIGSEYVPFQGFNAILASIVVSVQDLPGLISVIAYLAGLIMGVWGILNLKDHIQSPQGQPAAKEGIIRLLVGGAMLSFPTIMSVAKATVKGDGLGIIDWIRQALDIVPDDPANFFSNDRNCNVLDVLSGVVRPVTKTVDAVGQVITGKDLGLTKAVDGALGIEDSLGQVMCNVWVHTQALPAFITVMAYLGGLAIGLWALFKIRDHVLNPQQVSAWDGISKLLVAGALLAIPTIVAVSYNTVALGHLGMGHTYSAFNESAATSGNFSGLEELEEFVPGLDKVNGVVDVLQNGFNHGAEGKLNAGRGLDGMLANFMSDIFGPAQSLITWFTYIAGMVLITFGVLRLMKSSQEGPKGPGGIGTIMTFLTGGALVAFGPTVGAFSVSLFSSREAMTFAVLSYTEGMDQATIASAHIIISAILKFMIILGYISFARGLFMMKDVAEGNQQASFMAGMTHLIGGTIAVNLGTFINLVQLTLGLTGLGVGVTFL